MTTAPESASAIGFAVNVLMGTSGMRPVLRDPMSELSAEGAVLEGQKSESTSNERLSSSA